MYGTGFLVLCVCVCVWGGGGGGGGGGGTGSAAVEGPMRNSARTGRRDGGKRDEREKKKRGPDGARHGVHAPSERARTTGAAPAQR